MWRSRKMTTRRRRDETRRRRGEMRQGGRAGVR